MTTEPASLENLCVLYQNNDYIVVDKHWDIRIDSKMWYEKQTVQAQLKHRFPQLADPSTYYGFRSGSLFLTEWAHKTCIHKEQSLTVCPFHQQVLSSVGFLHKWGSLCCPK